MNKDEITKRIRSLPSGGLTKKKINGKEYTYYQWTQDGKQHSRTVKQDEIESLKSQIEERKKLSFELKKIDEQSGMSSSNLLSSFDFKTNVLVGNELLFFSNPVASYNKREIYKNLSDFVFGTSSDKVFILYGLRRTGKTTLIRQVLLNMTVEERSKAAFIQISPLNNLADLNKDLKTLQKSGIKYVFIDEVTFLEDFIEGAAVFSDIYAASGMKIILSGTDSLGFAFSEDEQLYDRAFFLHTTFIPFREFSKVLGIDDVDEYIKYGGTMSRSGENYNQHIFGTIQSTDEYVNTAIAKNIQHSLKNYQHGGHFRNLRSLYEKNELTSAINRIVEDMNHSFTVSVLTDDFKSHDLGISATNLRRDRDNPSDVLDDIDKATVTETLRKMIEILNKSEQTVKINEACASEIKEYLELLDLICDINLVYMGDFSNSHNFTVFTQPGLRYSQAEFLIKSLLQDKVFSNLSVIEMERICGRILDEIKGRMLEEIVLLETKKARKGKEVFKLQFAVGEFDMVVFDRQNLCCEIFEIKHSNEISEFQARHLVDEEKCRQTEFRYGRIKSKTVLYSGETKVLPNGIVYRNVEEYLKEL